MLRTIVLLLAGLFVVALSATPEGEARDNKPEPQKKACRCVCTSHSSNAENWNHIALVDASESCAAENVGECAVYNSETKKWEAGLAEACSDATPTVQGKPRPPKKRFPRPRKPSDPLPRSPGATP